MPTVSYFIVSLEEIVLETEDAVFGSRRTNVYKVVRHMETVQVILGQVLARSYVHAFVYLAGIPAYYFRAGTKCKSGGKRSFSACRRANYTCQVVIRHL